MCYRGRIGNSYFTEMIEVMVILLKWQRYQLSYEIYEDNNKLLDVTQVKVIFRYR